MERIRRFFKDEEGATAIEYALIASLVALAIIGGVTALGTNLGAWFTNVANYISSLSPTDG